MGERRLKASTIGYSTLESIPVFHFDPGHSALRIIVPPLRRVPVRFFNELLDELNRPKYAYSLEEVDVISLVDLARRWRTRAIFLDGIEPLSNEDVKKNISFFKSNGLHVGARTQGTLEDISLVKDLDFLVVDVSPEGTENAEVKVQVYEFLSEITSLAKPHVEVIVHMTRESPPMLVPVVNNVKRRDVPLHIRVYEPKGIAFETFLKVTKGSLDFIYLHSGGFSMLDTRCPKCRSYIALRERGILIKLELASGNRCPRCGTTIPFRGDISKATPKRVVRETRGDVVWYHPKALPLRKSF